MAIEIVARIGAIVVGTFCVAAILLSIVRTLVIPRPERVRSTMAVLDFGRVASKRLAQGQSSPERRNRILGTFAPMALISLPGLWSIGVVFAFSFVFWGIIGGTFGAALELSGSSLTTLGFVQAPSLLTRIIAIAEALIGLGLVALVISFLPTFYSAFSSRQIVVGQLAVRAGDPATPSDFITRLHRLGCLEGVGERWAVWEEWFVELGETHTSFPGLIYFRSARSDRSWLSAAETALDSAAIITATRLLPSTGQAETMIRSGYLALHMIASFYGVEGTDEPIEREHVSVARSEFEGLLDRVEAAGLSINVERDQAWHDFVGWRINYDHSLGGLRNLVYDVPTHWSIDGTKMSG